MGKATRSIHVQVTLDIHNLKHKSMIPGPGSYIGKEEEVSPKESKFDKTRAARIGTAQRQIFGLEIKSSIGPGPAAYNTDQAMHFVILCV
jgi:hypothetical protein